MLQPSADGDIARELGEETDETIFGALRDGSGGDDGKLRCWPGEYLRIGPGLQDDLREQWGAPIWPALRGGLEFSDVAVIATGADEVDVLVGDAVLPLDTPVVPAEELATRSMNSRSMRGPVA